MQNLADCPAYFEHIRGGHFCANAPARGPWSADHCHAGPVAGLIARALERAVPEKVLTRMTLDLVRPIPMAGFEIITDVEHHEPFIANSNHDDLYACIDLGIDRSVRQLSDHKSRLRDSKHNTPMGGKEL